MIHNFVRQKGGFISIRRQAPAELKDFPLHKDFEVTGSFWFPKNPRKKVHGLLTFRDGGPMSLRLDGLLAESHKEPFDEKLGVINGLIVGGLMCTIARYRGTVQTHGKDKAHVTFIEFEYLFLGKHFKRWESIFLNKLILQFTHLKVWFLPPLRSKSRRRTTVISHERDRFFQKFLINDNKERFILQHWALSTFPAGAGPDEITFTYKHYLYIVPPEKKHIEWYIQTAASLRDFFGFIIGTPIYTLETKGVIQLRNNLKRAPKGMNDLKVPIFFIPQQPEQVMTEAYYFRTTQRDVSIKDMRSLLNGWFIAYRKYQSAFRLYFSLMYANGLHQETVFLNLTQCAEHLYGLLFPRRDHYFAPSELKRVSDVFSRSLPNDLSVEDPFRLRLPSPPKIAEFLTKRVNNLNNISLQTKLDYLIDSVEPLSMLGGVFRSSAFDNAGKEIADLRHALTHPRSTNPLPPPEQFQQLCIELWALITFWLGKQFVSNESILQRLVFMSRYAEFLVNFPSGL